MAFANKRSTMTLYSSSDVDNHRARIVLAEKGILVDLIEIDRYGEDRWKDLQQINPYQTTPTLVDRDLILHQARIIMEYLEERFPHPPLLPVYPVIRAKFRLMVFEIENHWYPAVQRMQLAIKNNQENEAKQIRKFLMVNLTKIASTFKEYPYCLSQEFSLIDCSLAPILWRLPFLGINIDKQFPHFAEYAKRIFNRDAFKKSLTETESEMLEYLVSHS